MTYFILGAVIIVLIVIVIQYDLILKIKVWHNKKYIDKQILELRVESEKLIDTQKRLTFLKYQNPSPDMMDKIIREISVINNRLLIIGETIKSLREIYHV